MSPLRLAIISALAGTSTTLGAAEPNTPNVEEIVVTASGYQQNITEAPASITLIPASELMSRQVRDLADALERVEGVDVGQPLGKNGGRSISLRGMPAEYTLFLIDGRRQDAAGNVTPNGFDQTRSSFMPPASAIERIEVVRGPMSTLYGADAMGGVVNVITRMPKDQWGGELKMDSTFQSDSDFGNERNASAYLDGPLIEDTLALALRARHFERDDTELRFTDANGDPVEDGGIAGGPAITAMDVDTFGGRLTWTPTAGHKLWLDATLSEQLYDNSKGQLGTLGAGGYEENMEFSREQALLAYSGDVLGGTLDADLTRNTTTTEGRTLPSDVEGTTRQAGDPRQIESTNTMLNLKYYRRLGQHTATIGGLYWDAQMIEGLSPKPFEHTQKALFIEDEWRLLDPLALTLGARYDDHSVFGDHTSPRAYVVYNATNTLTVKGGVSVGYKAPTLDQLAPGIIGFGGQGTIPLVGSPDLEPETSTNYEIGLYYDGPGGLRANATVYQTDFEDKIARGTGVPNCSYGVSEADYEGGNYSTDGCMDVGYFPVSPYGPITDFGQSINVDKAETQGIELALRMPLGDRWSVSTNYTYTDSEQLTGGSAGEPLLNVPEHSVNATLNWDARDNLSLWLRSRYNSERYRGSFRGNSDAQDQLGSYKAFTIVNLGGTFRVNERLSLTATVYNLLDDDFVSYRPYTTRGATAYSNEYAIPEAPRRLWASINWTF